MLYKTVRFSQIFSSTYFKLNSIRLSSTVADLQQKWIEKFKQEKVQEPESSIKNLLAHVMCTKDLEEVDNKLPNQISDTQIKDLEMLCLARLCHMPVQYIIKEWDFHRLKGLKMSPPVFIPRPETEQLVSMIVKDLNSVKMDQLDFLEIGCGSGAITLSLLKELPKAKAIAIDQSKMAVDLTKENSNQFKLTDRIDILQYKIVNEKLPVSIKSESFDMIVSNPPYVLTKELLDLAEEIKLYEDLRALDGGVDGLKVIDNILKISEIYLKPSGVLWLETHPSHPTLLTKRLSNEPSILKVEECFKDFCDKDRFIKLRKNTKK